MDGKFLGFHEGRVRWAHSAFGAPVSVDAEAVDSVRVKQVALPLEAADCRVTGYGRKCYRHSQSLNEQALVLEIGMPVNYRFPDELFNSWSLGAQWRESFMKGRNRVLMVG